MWCHEPKSSKFVISRNVTFDENLNECVVDATCLREKESKQVELENKVT